MQNFFDTFLQYRENTLDIRSGNHRPGGKNELTIKANGELIIRNTLNRTVREFSRILAESQMYHIMDVLRRTHPILMQRHREGAVPEGARFEFRFSGFALDKPLEIAVWGSDRIRFPELEDLLSCLEKVIREVSSGAIGYF